MRSMVAKRATKSGNIANAMAGVMNSEIVALILRTFANAKVVLARYSVAPRNTTHLDLVSVRRCAICFAIVAVTPIGFAMLRQNQTLQNGLQARKLQVESQVQNPGSRFYLKVERRVFRQKRK